MAELFAGDAVIIVCLIFGAGLITLEALTPGMGLPGAAGVVFTAIGTALMWVRHGTLAGLLALLGSLVLIALAVLYSLKSATKGKLSKSRLILNDKIDGDSIDKNAALIGGEADAVTVLSPVGEIELDGQKYQALSEDGYIAKGARVTVTRTEGSKIFVRKTEA